MAINPALLVSAAMMQDYFVDNLTGQAMAAGVISMFQDNARTTYKNWYYQSGVPGAYTYLPLANPLTLSAVGTITDPSGQDTIPFYYPFDENDQSVSQTYYVTVVNANTQNQFTRQNFPSHTGGGGGGGGGAGQGPVNLIANNVFYHPLSINSPIDLTAQTNIIIAPSNHDGFMAASGNEFRFIKDMAGATDTMTFVPFAPGSVPFLPQQTPALYCKLVCSAPQGGQIDKLIQIPINIGIQTMDSLQVTFSIWAQGAAGGEALNFDVKQFAGSDIPGSSLFVPQKTFILTTQWAQYTYSFTMPTAAGIPLSATGDSAIYIDLNFPISTTFEIHFTKPALYIGQFSTMAVTGIADFQTNDQIDQIISGPRTGDVRTSINSFAPWGWAACNDGTIGSATSGADFASIETWNLYALLYLNVSNTYAPVTGGRSGSTLAAAAADFVAPKKMGLPKQLGNAIASQGLSATGAGTTWALGQNGGIENHNVTLGEIPNHAHSSAVGHFIVDSGGGDGIGTGAALWGAQTNTGTITSYPGASALSLVQPTTFYNVFLKL